MSDYPFCPVCDVQFTAEELQYAHTDDHGRDVHEQCCERCS